MLTKIRKNQWIHGLLPAALGAVILSGCFENSAPQAPESSLEREHADHSIGEIESVPQDAFPLTPTAKELESLQLGNGQEALLPDLALPERIAPLGKTAVQGETCDIKFNNPDPYRWIPGQAFNTFVVSPWYIEGCGGFYFHLKENQDKYQSSFRSKYGHYHLGWDGFCIVDGTRSGVLSGTYCEPKDPLTHNRYLNPHSGDTWLRGYVYKSGVSEGTFDFLSIRVRDHGIQVWVRKADASWKYYKLKPGYWSLNGATDVKEFLISKHPDGTNTQIWEIDDIRIRAPWY